MTFWRMVMIYVVTVMLHWWLMTHVAIWGMSPNLVFISAFSCAALLGPVAGIIMSFLWGLYIDILGIGLMGGYALTYTLAAYFVFWFKQHMDVVSPFSQAIMAWIVSFVALAFYQIIAVIFAHDVVMKWPRLIFEPFLNAAIAPFVFAVIRGIRSKNL